MFTLKNILRANASSCIIFGLIFLLFPTNIAVFLGSNEPIPEVILLVLGAALIVNGLHLLWASFKALPSKLLILYFSMGDFIWAVCSTALLIVGVWITTTLGALITILVAVMVATFGILQIIKRKKMSN